MRLWLVFICLISDLVPRELGYLFFNCIRKAKSSTGCQRVCVLLLKPLLFLTYRSSQSWEVKNPEQQEFFFRLADTYSYLSTFSASAESDGDSSHFLHGSLTQLRKPDRDYFQTEEESDFLESDDREYDDDRVAMHKCQMFLTVRAKNFLLFGKYFYFPLGAGHLNARFIWLFTPFKANRTQIL